MTFHPAYDEKNHWRFTQKQDRLYATWAVIYNEFVPEVEKTFDFISCYKGHKWNIVQHLAREHTDVLKQYRYIGCFDDDLITDIEAVNTLVARALHFNWKLAQLSMLKGSGAIYRCTQQNTEWSHSKTNFIEMGSPIFRQDIFFKLMDFMAHLDITIGWGIDKLFCEPGVLGHQTEANVVHSHSIYHPHFSVKPSYYDQSLAMQEMHETFKRSHDILHARGYDMHLHHDVQMTLDAWTNLGQRATLTEIEAWSGRSGSQ
jgi:hypothetical protein